MIRYGSVCSGIESASCAWHPLGWTPQWFAEIEPFPSAVLAHRWPGIPNLGDFTKIGAEHGPVDLLVGGTPCQSFSVAGLRGGLADDRGNLALEFLRLAARVRARWLVWENVPGVLSSNDGRDFGSILGGMVELGYGYAYRILDAQFFGVPQRRRRVLVVGYLGDWRPAAAVLFERASLRGDSPPSRKAREDVAGTLAARTRAGGGLGTAFDLDGGVIVPAPGFIHPRQLRNSQSSNQLGIKPEARVSDALTSEGPGAVLAQAFRHHMGGAPSNRMNLSDAAPTLDRGPTPAVIAFDPTQVTHPENRSNPQPGDPAPTLAKGAHPPAIAFQERGRDGERNLEHQAELAYALTSPGDGGRRHEMNVCAPVAFSAKDHGADAGEIAPTLRAGGHSESHANGGVMPAVAFQKNASHTNSMNPSEVAPTLDRCKADGMSVQTAAQVRRLTPRECERLQGFEDNWTLVPYNGKAAADGPRYKAIGNSMAVPCMSWIGKRIAQVEQLVRTQLAEREQSSGVA